jgi:hypothetical protein
MFLGDVGVLSETHGAASQKAAFILMLTAVGTSTATPLWYLLN